MSEIIPGLHCLKELKDKQQKSKVDDNFCHIFNVEKFPKTTFYLYKKVIDLAPTAIIEEFVGHGETHAGLWTQFIKNIQSTYDNHESDKDEFRVNNGSDTVSPSGSHSPSQHSNDGDIIDISSDSDHFFDDFFQPVDYQVKEEAVDEVTKPVNQVASTSTSRDMEVPVNHGFVKKQGADGSVWYELDKSD